MTRAGIWIVSAVMLILSAAAAQTRPMQNEADAKVEIFAAVNTARAAAGVAPVTLSVDLSAVALDHTLSMADANRIFHSVPLWNESDIAGTFVGQNVGTGDNLSVVLDAFIASPPHYAILTDPRFTRIGIGVVWRPESHAIFITERFTGPPTAPLPAPTAPPTTTTTSTPPREEGAPDGGLADHRSC